MTYKKSLVVGIILLILVGVLFSINTYTSSPGFVSQEDRETFYANIPTCYGVSILLNEKDTWGDAPGRSLCVGYLMRNDTLVISAENELTQENLTVLQNQLDRRNENKDDFPGFREEFTPTVVGTHNGTTVEERYWCNDSCPDNGIIYLNYVSSSEETCEDLGGIKLYKWGWGSQYVGCSPTENKYSD